MYNHNMSLFTITMLSWWTCMKAFSRAKELLKHAMLKQDCSSRTKAVLTRGALPA